MKILVTGGTGFIGSHTCVELLDAGYDVVIIDNLSNSKKEVVDYIQEITGKKAPFYEGDVCDKEVLRKIFKENKIDAIIHFAGYKAVGESVSKPIMYYRNNLDSTISLIEAANEFNVKKIAFSSSATVYGKPKSLPIKECFPLSTTNPYGTTKLMIERILRDLYVSDNEWSIAILRYFNPIGAHKSGLIGEEPNGVPANIMPYISKVASGKLECLSVFGDDYDTKDGTGVRDYIHVVDLAIGHIKAVEKLSKENKGLYIYNLGTGIGYSVLDLISTFERVNNKKINYRIAPRRKGDIAICYSDPTKAKEELGFSCTLSLDDMVKSRFARHRRGLTHVKQYFLN